MSWTSFHRRGDVLSTAIATANARRDGVLPSDVEGVAATFRDDEDLLGALQLRWYTRLAGRIEAVLAEQPLDLEAGVIDAWIQTAEQLPGVRLVLDRAADGADGDFARTLSVARAKERALLAVMAGRADRVDARAAAVGAGIEEAARSTYERRREAGSTAVTPRGGLMERLRSAFAA